MNGIVTMNLNRMKSLLSGCFIIDIVLDFPLSSKPAEHQHQLDIYDIVHENFPFLTACLLESLDFKDEVAYDIMLNIAHFYFLHLWLILNNKFRYPKHALKLITMIPTI